MNVQKHAKPQDQEDERNQSRYEKTHVEVHFFFQAEDGIRDLYVTGVQTCALPICIPCSPSRSCAQAAAGSASTSAVTSSAGPPADSRNAGIHSTMCRTTSRATHPSQDRKSVV